MTLFTHRPIIPRCTIIMSTKPRRREFVGNREDLFIVETIIIVHKLAASEEWVVDGSTWRLWFDIRRIGNNRAAGSVWG